MVPIVLQYFGIEKSQSIANFPNIAKIIAKGIAILSKYCKKYCKISKYCKNYCNILRSRIFFQAVPFFTKF